MRSRAKYNCLFSLSHKAKANMPVNFLREASTPHFSIQANNTSVSDSLLNTLPDATSSSLSSKKL